MNAKRSVNNSRAALLTSLAASSQTSAWDRWRLNPVVWLALAAAWVFGVGWLLDPIRPHAHDQLLDVPRYGLEIALGALSVVASVTLAFRLSRPNAATSVDIGLTLLAISAWAVTLAMAWAHPPIEPSMFGKRLSCEWEAFALSLPPAIAGVLMLRGGFVTRPWLAGVLLAFSAGALPAVFMQFACMIEPSHMISHHLLPAAIVTVLMGIVGALAVRPAANRR